MFDVGLPEFFVLGVIALLVFGPERLPEVAMQAARLIRRLRGMAESAKTELTADLEPHMRELRELRELDPRKMAKRYVLDPVKEDGTLDELRGKGLRDSISGKSKKKKPNVKSSETPSGGSVAGAVGAAAAAGEATNGSAPGQTGSASATESHALPPAMAPAVTAPGERPPYDIDAT